MENLNAQRTIEELQEEVRRLQAELAETRSDLWARERQMTQICLLMERAWSGKWLTPAGASEVLTLLMGLERDRMMEIIDDAKAQIALGQGAGKPDTV